MHAVRDWLGRICVEDPLYRARVILGDRHDHLSMRLKILLDETVAEHVEIVLYIEARRRKDLIKRCARITRILSVTS